MLEPYKGRIFDPCCGSGGMFVQSEKEHIPVAYKEDTGEWSIPKKLDTILKRICFNEEVLYRRI